MQYISKNQFEDEIRVRDGLIVTIIKYKRIGNYMSPTALKGKTKRVCKGVIQATMEITETWGIKPTTFPVGTYFKRDIPIEIVPKEEYTYSITTSGGTMYGDSSKILHELVTIENIVGEYKLFGEIK